jgi:hypothetical protein
VRVSSPSRWATRTGDTFRFLASQDNTTVSVNGSPVATLNKGKYYETVLTAASVVTADNPIHVMQYSNGQQVDGLTARMPIHSLSRSRLTPSS